MELYHGSSHVIERPALGVGNPHNDYGLGFYCTQSLDMACEWASSEDANGFANHYRLDCERLAILDLSAPEYHILNWLAVLLENRVFRADGAMPLAAKKYILERFMPCYKDCDVVVGYRADDSYFSFATAFLNGAISVETLGRAMHLGRLGIQVVPRSERAFEALSFVDAAPVDRDLWFPKKASRDAKARADFRKMRDSESALTGHYAIDMLREEWGDDAAWLR